MKLVRAINNKKLEQFDKDAVQLYFEDLSNVRQSLLFHDGEFAGEIFDAVNFAVKSYFDPYARNDYRLTFDYELLFEYATQLYQLSPEEGISRLLDRLAEQEGGLPLEVWYVLNALDRTEVKVTSGKNWYKVIGRIKVNGWGMYKTPLPYPLISKIDYIDTVKNSSFYRDLVERHEETEEAV